MSFLADNLLDNGPFIEGGFFKPPRSACDEQQ
jgi:hypothetical protein